MLDPNIFSKYKTKQDFDREAEEFEFRKRQRQMQEQLGQMQVQTMQRDLNAPEQLTPEQLLAKSYQLGGIEKLSPQEQAQLRAFDVLRTSQQSQNPLTGGLYQKNRSILDMSPSQAMGMPIPTASTGGFNTSQEVIDDAMIDDLMGVQAPTGDFGAPPLPAEYVDIPEPIDQGAVIEDMGQGQFAPPIPQIGAPSMQGMYLPTQQDVLSYAAKKNIDLQALNQQERIKVMNELAKEMQLQRQKTEREKIQKRRQEDFAFESALGQKDVVDSAINQIVDQVTAFNTGVVGSRNPFSQSGANIEALLKTVESDATLSKLVELKQAGGTLGQVTEKELALLQSSRAALARIQDPGQFIEQLSKYKNARNRAINNIANAYNKEFGEYPTGYAPLSQPRQISAREFLSQ